MTNRSASFRRQASGRGAALVITLAFVVLLTTVLIVFFTEAVNFNLQSNSTLNDQKSAMLGKSALETVVSGLEQEVVNGSTVITYANGSNVYYPTANSDMIPQRSGNPAFVNGVDPIPNLVRISTSSETFPTGTPAVSSLASAVNSITPALGGQYVSPARWNKHYLIPRANAGSTTIDTTPISQFNAPDWVFVTDQGPTVITKPTTKVIGRYAYAIYDEGGLLDANVAGFPTNTVTNAVHPAPNPDNLPVWGSGLKGSEAFADLTAMTNSAGAPLLTQAQVDQLVGWRNNASAQPSGTYNSYNFSSTAAVSYHDAMVTSTNGFLTVATNVVSDPSNGGKQDTDQIFPTRQSLIAFMVNAVNTGVIADGQDALQYLATFTRALEQPCYNPPVGRPEVQSGATANSTTFGTGNDAYGTDRSSPSSNSASDINPPLLAERVVKSFTRSDGTTAQVGYPLIKERFPLSRLSLFPLNGAAPSGEAAQLIQQYFGLTKNSSGVWIYNHDSSNTAGIDRLNAVASLGREPDFFELLKAAIDVGSVAKGDAYHSITSSTTYTTPGNVGYLLQAHDTLTALQILQIGANIIDQSKADNFPTRIEFSGDTTVPPNIVAGSEDLPYLYRIRNWITQYGAGTSTSQVAFLVQPELWSPYSYNAAAAAGLGSSGFVAAASTPTSFRVRLEQDPSSSTVPINASATYSDNSTLPLTDVSLDAPNYAPSTSGTPNPAPLTFNAGELNGFWGFREPTLLASPGLCPSAHLVAGNFSQKDLNNGTVLVGFPIATFPWINTADSPTATAQKFYIAANGDPACLRCYVDYKDPISGNWVNYDQQVIEYMGGSPASIDVHAIGGGNTTYSKALASNNYDDLGWIRTDPRTSRWGAMNSQYLYDLPVVDASNNEFGSQRPDGGVSYGSHLGGLTDVAFINSHAGYSKQGEGFQQGYWVENSVRQTYQSTGAGSPGSLRFNLDPDGVPRRAMAGYLTDTTNGGHSLSVNESIVGMPMAIGSGTVTDNAPVAPGTNPNTSAVSPAYGSRPTILHRPFRSVAELGYVFRETPWGNINFTFPESGDSALLDVFCINDTASTGGLVSGRVDLNTRQAPVLAALISGALQDKDDSTTPTVSEAVANQLGAALVQRTSNPAVATPITFQGPLESRADLVGTWIGPTSATSSGSALKTAAANVTIDPDKFYTGFSHDVGTTAVPGVNGTPPMALIPRQRDAVMRGLVDSGTTRTWNLLIDLVAQTGKFALGNTSSLSNFIVDGEKHYWLHVSIDRYTGAVLGSQLEVVKE